MRLTRIAPGVLLAHLALGASLAHATEQILYKSVLPDGTVSYSDKPIPGTRAEPLAVEPHPANPKAAQAAEISAVKRREQMLRDFDARAARAAELDQHIPVAASVAEQARELARRGAAVQEGDRQGRRLTSEYFRRQQLLQTAQAQAEVRLDALVQQRAALQP
ncbi:MULTISPECIES: DUF4124 domain-containing protein [Acidovorax]|uniref:DUF4124 domain-containing protein n=1 Tax=Acidovorax facilis TaxID=12917 RepID=A0ABV8D8N2_9BURK|nr:MULTISPECIES: DUF4124 domain-containing protein [Acidovorax]MBO1010929.1 DUF4124 domain-containing protein [Acidovorax sp. SD340]MCO4244909.1 DUF4124 domain-containing protein [Acidovorax facilis]